MSVYTYILYVFIYAVYALTYSIYIIFKYKSMIYTLFYLLANIYTHKKSLPQIKKKTRKSSKNLKP